MFRRIVGGSPERAAQLFRLHPMELSTLLELSWEFRVWERDKDPGHPNRRSDVPQFPPDYLDELLRRGETNIAQQNRSRFKLQSDGDPIGRVRWDHLIYAYLIENTRLFELFRRVVYEYTHGERLGAPTVDSQHWLRNTEELFFRDPAPFSIYGVVSHLRSDNHATRRSVYYRMFGMELNHGTDDNKPYPYHKPEASNTEFVATFEEFLREVWIGISNVNNTSGVNPTDNATIANLAKQLHDMLRTRRTNGNLSREEFWYVAMMSWFHLTLEFNHSIIISLRADAVSPEQRLFKIAERVNTPAHAKSRDFFLLAEPASRILTQIETGIYNDPAAVPALYTPIAGGPEADMRRIITHWSIATGRDLKVRRGVDLGARQT